MNNLVTIGIPFYNNREQISLSLKSVQNQTYQNLEIILVDDGSTDDSLTYVQEISKNDPRIKILSDGYNKGLIKRLNQIIEVAHGDYIARMDADDIIHPSKIEEQIKLLRERPEIDVVTTAMISLDQNLNPIGKRNHEREIPHLLNVFKNGSDILHASMIAKTSWWKKNKYLDGFDRAEDRELFTRTLKKSHYYNITKPLYFYVDAPNMSLKKFVTSYKSERKAIIKNWRGSIAFSTLITLLIRSYLKSIVIRFYFLMNIQNKIFTNKNINLNTKEIEEVNQIIKNYL